MYDRSFTHKGKNQSTTIGILMMIALYSINLTNYGADNRENSIGRPNIPLLNSDTLFSPIS